MGDATLGAETQPHMHAAAGMAWGATLLGVIAAGALLWAERRRALRELPAEVEGRQAERVITNLALAGLSTVVADLAMTPVVQPLAIRSEQRGTGLTQQLPVPVWVRDALAVVLLDYTLYWWHVIEHRIEWLYRLHQVHHADLALDASTALRFHFGEFAASIPWRAAQVAVIGASPRALRTWQRMTMLSVLFHHSNVRLPFHVERLLARVVMTPRLHGIHHSMVADEQNSNWSSGLTIWDRMHGTYRANVHQGDIEMGIPAHRDLAALGLGASLSMPFEPLPAWLLPDGTEPHHAPAGVPRRQLLP